MRAPAYFFIVVAALTLIVMWQVELPLLLGWLYAVSVLVAAPLSIAMQFLTGAEQWAASAQGVLWRASTALGISCAPWRRAAARPAAVCGWPMTARDTTLACLFLATA